MSQGASLVEALRPPTSLLERARCVAGSLPPPRPGSEVALAFGHDRVAFAAALLGTWLAGHAAALARDAKRVHVGSIITRPNSVAFLHDKGMGYGLDVPQVLADATRRVRAPDTAADRSEFGDREVLRVFCDRGRGDISTSSWTARALLDELDALIAAHRLSEGAVVGCAMAPSSAPAALLGLLAPLRAGARYWPSTPTTAAEIADRASADQVAVLVATAAQARDMAALPAPCLRSVARLACADGPLDEVHRRALGAHRDLSVVDLPALDVSIDRAPVTLAAIDALLEMRGVRDVAAAVRPDAGGTGPCVLIGAVAPDVPLRALEEAVDAAFAVRDDPGRPDRLVRKFAALDRDEYGRLSSVDLFLRFGLGGDGRELEDHLDWLEEDRRTADDGELAATFSTRLPVRFRSFEGHFVTYPLLAGAAQLHELVLPCARRVRPELGELSRLSGVKFMARIAPGDSVDVEVRFPAGSADCHFEIRRGRTRCSSGRASFKAAAGGDGA